MELIVSHELIGEESLITNDSFRNTVVLLSPFDEKLPESRALPDS